MGDNKLAELPGAVPLLMSSKYTFLGEVIPSDIRIAVFFFSFGVLVP